MNTAHQSVMDSSLRDAPTPHHLASWYAPGWSDAIGDRLLMFDNTSAPSLELLRFNPVLPSAPGFELALRERVELLRGFRHPSFSEIRAVESLDGGVNLALVSNHVPGKRLSEVVRQAKGPSFALALIRQLTPALVLLQQQGTAVAHGALSADRIVVTPDGRLVIIEHVLGPALERLNLTAARLWADFRIAAPVAKSQLPRLDGRADVVQLAVTALTLLLGRPLRADETPDRFPALLDQIEKAGGNGSASSSFLRNWLGRALQVDGRLFGSALDAQEALRDLPYERGQQRGDFSRMLAEPRESLEEDVEPAGDDVPTTPAAIILRHPAVAAGSEDPALRDTADPVPAIPLFSDERDIAPPRAQSTRSERAVRPISAQLEYPYRSNRTATHEVAAPQHASRVAASTRAVDQKPARTRKGTPAWMTAALALVVVSEAAVIGGLVYVKSPLGFRSITIESVQPGSDVLVDGRSVGVTPLTLKVDSTTRSVRVVAPAAVTARQAVPEKRVRESSAGAGAHSVVAPPVIRTGGLQLSSRIDVDVIENGRVLGSNARPIIMPPGVHQLELINTTLGYHARQAVVVKTGQTTSLDVPLPNGRVSINALPWAEVWIDGRAVGETPLGNLSIPIGAHEIVFRHPQLGERRQLAVVRTDAVSRVSVNLQQ